jgi:hypothetical protein
MKHCFPIMQMVSPVHSKLLTVCVKMITWSISIEKGPCCFWRVQQYLMWQQATTFEKLISKHRYMLAMDLNFGEWQVYCLQCATVYCNSFPVVNYIYWTDHKAGWLLFQCQIQGGIREFPDCYCCNYLRETWWEVRPRSHFCKPVASVCRVTLHSEHALFLHKCFLTSCFILSAMDSKVEQCCLHQILCEAW